MKYRDRHGNTLKMVTDQEKILYWMYGTKTGRMLTKILIQPCVSKMAGHLLDSQLSVPLIQPFVKKHHISMADFEDKKYTSYNDFFTRKVKDGKRSFAQDVSSLTAPCDGRLTVYRIGPYSQFTIKNAVYTMKSLTRSKKIADYYKGGYLLVFRLCPEDYHRYAFIDDGIKTPDYRIQGVYHTVNPVAGKYYPVYKENTREYSLLKTRNHGVILMMEVGALLVGRIKNRKITGKVKRGMEKGCFEFGGSTVILALKNKTARIDHDILENSLKNCETFVKMGEKIGDFTKI